MKDLLYDQLTKYFDRKSLESMEEGLNLIHSPKLFSQEVAEMRLDDCRNP